MNHTVNTPISFGAWGTRSRRDRSWAGLAVVASLFYLSCTVVRHNPGDELGAQNGSPSSQGWTTMPGVSSQDTSVQPECGNGRVDANEVCDNSALLPIGCVDLGFLAGQIRCSRDCSSYDLAGCHSCGDGIRQGPEKCDGNDLGGHSCATAKPGLDGGPLACAADCRFDLSQCTGSPSGSGGKGDDEVKDSDGKLHCGDSKLDPGEDCDCGDTANCDVSQLGGKDCKSLGFEGGQLRCLSPSTCMFDTQRCWHCGDGIKTGSENCDGNDLGGQSCRSLGMGNGQLGCTADCDYDPTHCEKSEPIEWYELCQRPGQNGYKVYLPDAGNGLAMTFRNSRSASITDVQVILELEHTQVGDLYVQLERGQRRLPLLTRPGRSSAAPRGCAGDNVEVLLSDAADTLADDTCKEQTPTIDGELRPTQSFEVFHEQPMRGIWRVLLWDRAYGERGSIERVCLRFR